MTHLDTSFIVDLLRESRRGGSGPARALLSTLGDEPLGLSVFACCELEVGVERSHHPERERKKIADVCENVSLVYPDERLPRLYGKTLSRLLDAGRSISEMDLLIACTALADDATLVTGNRKHFDVVPRLRVLSY